MTRALRLAAEAVPGEIRLDAAVAGGGARTAETCGGGARSAPLPLPSLLPGDLFDGRYRIEELVGRGGMAVVYRARHLALDQRRAIKLLVPERLTGPEAVDQLRGEAIANSRIHHVNVVRHA